MSVCPGILGKPLGTHPLYTLITIRKITDEKGEEKDEEEKKRIGDCRE
jgi:hypothetical protein